MDRQLFQTATTGDANSPWRTLLKSGAESLNDASSRPPAPSAAESIWFYPPDDQEVFSEDNADFLLDKARLRQLRVGAAAGKRFPETRLEKLIRCFDLPESPYLTDEEKASLCGNAGRALALFSRNDALLRKTPPLFPYEPLDDAILLRETTRVATSDAVLPVRRSAIQALRSRDPRLGRELLERVVERESGDEKTREKVLKGLLPALWTGLGNADAPFLEETVAREKLAVAREALMALGTLPDTRIGARLSELGDAIFADDGSVVEPEYSKELKSLGFAKDKGSVLAARILGAIPLEYWEERFGESPAEIAERVPFSPATEPIYAGWVISYVNFGADRAWLEAAFPMIGPLNERALADEEIKWLLVGSNNEYEWGYGWIFENRARELRLELAKAVDLRRAELETNTPAGRDYAQLLVRANYEPMPWSDAFCDEFERGSLDAPCDSESHFDRRLRELANYVDLFPPKARDRVVARLKEVAGDSHLRRLAALEGESNAKNVAEGERRFGDFRRNLYPERRSHKRINELRWARPQRKRDE